MITHDVDEALFLADRLVMMTNGPSATIGEIMKMPFPRPRDRTQIMEDPQYYQLRNYALDCLFDANLSLQVSKIRFQEVQLTDCCNVLNDSESQ